jgi:hypothetical protein
MSAARRLIITALVLALSLPAAAQARAASPGPAYRIETRSTNGYKVLVIAQASTLTLGVLHYKKAEGAATYYLARANTSGGKIRSRIGNLGEVSLTFHPGGSERVRRRNCFSRLTRPAWEPSPARFASAAKATP